MNSEICNENLSKNFVNSNSKSLSHLKNKKKIIF